MLIWWVSLFDFCASVMNKLATYLKHFFIVCFDVIYVGESAHDYIFKNGRNLYSVTVFTRSQGESCFWDASETETLSGISSIV